MQPASKAIFPFIHILICVRSFSREIIIPAATRFLSAQFSARASQFVTIKCSLFCAQTEWHTAIFIWRFSAHTENWPCSQPAPLQNASQFERIYGNPDAAHSSSWREERAGGELSLRSVENDEYRALQVTLAAAAFASCKTLALSCN
jgi:hypothetical protein